MSFDDGFNQVAVGDGKEDLVWIPEHLLEPDERLIKGEEQFKEFMHLVEDSK